MKYRTFLRSATSFEDWSSAEKTTVEEDLTLEQAIEDCKVFNRSRSQSEIASGTKLEFELEDEEEG